MGSGRKSIFSPDSKIYSKANKGLWYSNFRWNTKKSQENNYKE